MRGFNVRLLMLHSDYFKYQVVERTRFSEDVDEAEKSGIINEPVLVVFVCSEKVDEAGASQVARKAAEEIINIASQVGTDNVVLHSFAHLSNSLSSPKIAKKIIGEIHQNLSSRGYRSVKTPFGWRDTFELRVKSHPVSKVSRKILPE